MNWDAIGALAQLCGAAAFIATLAYLAVQLRQNNLLDEETWLSYRQVILSNHSSALGRRWWDKVGRTIVDPEFAKAVDELLIGASPDTTYRNMSSWADQDND